MTVGQQQQQLATVDVALGDGIEGMEHLVRGSAALVLSDLPSGETSAPFDVRPDLDRFWPAAWHALREDGVAVLMASNFGFAATLVASAPRDYRHDLIWSKSMGVGFLNASLRPLRSHEFLIVFSRKLGTYNPQMIETGVPISYNGARGALGSENYGWSASRGKGKARSGATDRYPRSVLTFGSLPTRDRARVHPQQKPVDLMRYLVRMYSNRDDLVLDPFAGSGTTGEACAAEVRRFHGWDIDRRFARKTSEVA